MKQFRLTAEGEILFQPDPTNPLPGKAAGRIVKGDALLSPRAVIESPDIDQAAAEEWLRAYIAETLAPLVALSDSEEIQDCARAIAGKLHEALGIVPRAALEDLIALLNEEGRAALRARKVRLGPVLVFLPALNKPAAVRLRALLWTLWHDGALPAFAPPDGITSLTVPPDSTHDPVYWRAIGYPVYGPRAIRVDMLDRLIGAIYDSADKGVFRAKHEMAEWLGCTIPDLYAVLEAMDHKKIDDPAEAKPVSAAEDPSSEESDSSCSAAPSEAQQEIKGDASAAVAADSAAPDAAGSPPPQEKPVLALFRLRRGKAYGGARPPRREGSEKTGKPFRKPAAEKQSRDSRRSEEKAPRFKDKKPRPEPRERVISSGPEKRIEDSPFAVLKNLKVGNKE